MRGIVNDIKPLIPKGQATMPLRISLSGGILSFTVRGVCNYESKVKVDTDDVAEVTVTYINIADYIKSNSECELDVTNNGMQISCADFSSFMVPAYSVLEELKLPDIQYKSIENSSLVTALNTLSGTGIDGFYRKSSPIEVYERLAILKYPNIYVQLRAPDMDSSFAITQDCAKIISLFNPKEYAIASSDTVVFKKYDTLLAVPIKLVQPGVSVKDVIKENSYSLKLDVGEFTGKIGTLRKLKVDRADVVLKKAGISATVSAQMSKITVSTGDAESDYVASFALPVDLLHICFRLLGDSLAEILYKEGILCLRTPNIAIAVRVLA